MIAASGAVEYEAVAGNEAQLDWLNSTLDRCIMYIAGNEKEFTKRLGGDDAFMERMLEPLQDCDGLHDGESSEEAEQ